jgi:GT2 family glycosyltransferase
MEPHVSIIILNWNGWKDTIECLESVLKLDYPYFNIILIDNNSLDDSINQLISWAEGNNGIEINSLFDTIIYPLEKKPVSYYVDEMSSYEKNKINKKDAKILIIKSDNNIGFARACNKGMEIARSFYQSDYYLLLNNDTIVKKDTLTNLITILEKNKSIGAAQATIYNYSQARLIDNAGGQILFWGQTKYYHKIGPTEIKTISFIHGCALCVRSEVISKHGQLTEKYFFGEEDFEFSYRLNKLSIPMVCVGNSQVFHKVGTSSQLLLKNAERKILLFAVNRIVDLRDIYPNLLWIVWKYFALIYFGYLLLKNKIRLKRILHILRVINRNVGNISDVRKETIEEILKKL